MGKGAFKAYEKGKWGGDVIEVKVIVITNYTY